MQLKKTSPDIYQTENATVYIPSCACELHASSPPRARRHAPRTRANPREEKRRPAPEIVPQRSRKNRAPPTDGGAGRHGGWKCTPRAE